MEEAAISVPALLGADLDRGYMLLGDLGDRLLLDVSQSQFLSWFDLMGLERHIKVLGTFARLYLRDRKPAYLKDMPLVVRYVREILEKYRPQHVEIAAFAAWFEAEMVPVINSQDWSETP